jgi:monoamine oxidase
MSDDVLDVAIVGGGISGVWSGWRLTGESAGPGRRQRVAVFEMSDRVGGRLLSVELPGLAGVACELGGMRYMSSQPLVSWLVETELRLPVQDAPVSEEQNLAYLRNRRLRLSDLTDGDLVPYNLAGADRGVAPDELLARAVDAIVPGVRAKTGTALRQAVDDAVFDGRPVWAQGFWNLLARTMDHEAYRFAEEAGGYDTVLLNWNAADSIVLNFDFAPGVAFHRISAGYEEVPRQLARRFEAQGGELQLQEWVRSLDVAVLGDGSPCVVLDVVGPDGSSSPVRARSAILALPRRSLELMAPTGPVLGDPGFRRLLTTVTPIPLFKAFLAYHESWWEQVGVTRGRSVTDLPLRQVYYWASKGPDQNGALLATYDDTLNVGFWQGLAADDQRYQLVLDHVPQPRRGEIAADAVHPRWKAVRAPAALAREVHRQLLAVHGVDVAPDPYAAVYHDWSADPYGGGVNFWNVGVRSGEVLERMVQPVGSAPVYVCGEAYSQAQGWVEGALQTAELVLTRHLGVDALPLPPAGEGAVPGPAAPR